MSDSPKIDSKRWTGGPGASGLVARRLPPRWVFVILGVLLSFPVYLGLWHLLWLATGSPPVRSVTSLLSILIAAAGAVAMFLVSRGSDDRWAWAVAGGVVSTMLAHLTIYLSDFLLARGEYVSTHFVERKEPPSLRRRHFQISPELRLTSVVGPGSSLVLDRPSFDRLIAGNSCLTLVERKGLLYRFPTRIRVSQSPHLEGAWLYVPARRQGCVGRRVSAAYPPAHTAPLSLIEVQMVGVGGVVVG